LGTDEHSRVFEVLAAKLVNFFHAEQRHAGRPLKARKQTAPKLAKVCGSDCFLWQFGGSLSSHSIMEKHPVT